MLFYRPVTGIVGPLVVGSALAAGFPILVEYVHRLSATQYYSTSSSRRTRRAASPRSRPSLGTLPSLRASTTPRCRGSSSRPRRCSRSPRQLPSTPSVPQPRARHRPERSRDRLRERVERPVQSRLEPQLAGHRLGPRPEERLRGEQRLCRRHDHSDGLEAQFGEVARGQPDGVAR